MIRRRKSWHATLLNNWQFLSSSSLPSQFWYQPCPSHSGSARSEAGLIAAQQDSLSLRPGSVCSTHCFLWLGASHFAPAQESGGSRVTGNTSTGPSLQQSFGSEAQAQRHLLQTPVDTVEANVSFSKAPAVSVSGCMLPTPFLQGS